MGLEKNKINRALGLLLVVLIVGFAAIILLQVTSMFLGPSKRACTKKICLAKFLEGPPAFNDETLREYISSRYFFESLGPPKYEERKGFDPVVDSLAGFVFDYFKDKRDGKFVVLGAGDGEYMDITIPLEKDLGWKGFLVEPNPELFEKLKAKGRNAILSSNCISPFSYPSMTTLGHPKIDVGDSEETRFEKLRKTKLKQLFEDDTDLVDLKVQCVPLENLLYAAGMEKHVDLIVLDMNGSDLDVLINVKLDMIPQIEMIVIRSNGNEIGSDVGGYFLDKNMILKKVFGTKTNEMNYVLTRFKGDDDL